MSSSQPDPAPAADPESVRRAAEEILSRPEFREPEPTLADRVLGWIGDLLGEVVRALTGGGAGGVAGTIVIVALLALAAWFLVRALRAPTGRRRGAAAVVVHGTEAPQDPAAWAAEAERRAAAGDHRGALRCRYQELVAHLVRDRAVPDDPARTPAELRQALAAGDAALAPVAGEVTERFEAAWYGGEPVDRAGYERFATAAAELRELAGSDRAQAGASR